MNWRRLSRVTAPSRDPVTLAEAKAQTRVDGTDEDDYITDLISRAVAMIDGPHGIGICMISQQWKMTLDYFPLAPIDIPLGPVISVDSITYVDGDGATQTVTASDYRVSNAGDLVRIEPAYGVSWPTTRAVIGAVAVTFTAGYVNTGVSPETGTVPADLTGAIKGLVSYWNENREITGDDSDMLRAVERIFAKYRVGTIAA